MGESGRDFDGGGAVSGRSSVTTFRLNETLSSSSKKRLFTLPVLCAVTSYSLELAICWVNWFLFYLSICTHRRLVQVCIVQVLEEVYFWNCFPIPNTPNSSSYACLLLGLGPSIFGTSCVGRMHDRLLYRTKREASGSSEKTRSHLLSFVRCSDHSTLMMNLITILSFAEQRIQYAWFQKDITQKFLTAKVWLCWLTKNQNYQLIMKEVNSFPIGQMLPRTIEPLKSFALVDSHLKKNLRLNTRNWKIKVSRTADQLNICYFMISK